jgi:CHAT domain-containing protein
MWSNADPQELDSRAGVDRSIRSMLVLAGANEPARGGKDGLLTAFELMGGPDLRGTHLVVLAACSSGAEESEQDGGAQGMRRAMQIAGARCVIASGFDVPAKQSLELMDEFRAAWLAEGGMSRVQAFAHAKRGALARARERDGSGHPLWWAGFSYFGDPGAGPLPADLRAP